MWLVFGFSGGRGERHFRACSVIFNPYGLEGIDMD
jgi:hypothetical protein